MRRLTVRRDRPSRLLGIPTWAKDTPTRYPGATSEKTLWLALGLTSTFLGAEVIGGLVMGSLALLSDAAHMFTDAAALAIALAAVRIARRAADLRRSYGYHRFEILAAAFNALLLFGVAISSMKRGNGCASPPRSRPPECWSSRRSAW